MPTRKRLDLINRELSWLSFNARVLQEAQDKRVPLYERLKFLAIYSSNLDEFFRVRVASLRSLLRLRRRTVDKLGIQPGELLRRIHETVTAQQEQFGAVFRREILPELEEHGIRLVDESAVTDDQISFLRTYFAEHVRAHVNPRVLGQEEAPFLENQQIYLAAELGPKGGGVNLSAREPQIGLVEIPTPPVERFVCLPSGGDEHYVMFLDDVVRCNLGELFPEFEVGASFAVKLSRDAELYLDDEYGGSIVEQIKKSLSKRERGLPCRFLYDLHASFRVVSRLEQTFDLADEDLVLGGRYHNLHDLEDFPQFGLDELTYEELPPLPHPALEHASSMFEAVAEKDRIVHYPYQRFDYVVRFLEEAVDDPAVESIWITLYRTAPNSRVVKALMAAARAGKQVTVFVEVKARFDEASNLDWAARMEEAGIRTLYSFRDVKVHAKMLLVGRREAAVAHTDESKLRLYAYLGTGNFNEVTATIYADHGLFTADERLTGEVRRVFAFLAGEESKPNFDHLLVAPFHFRKAVYRLIERERKAAAKGETGRIFAKMNALEDEKMIEKLYQASGAGVEIDMIVRGICCLLPGLEGRSENIRVRSIIDRFLEHARLFIFHNSGNELYYLSSADWMTRNLSRRVEVAFPIYDHEVRRELREIAELQWRDNTKARIIDADQKNAYATSDETGEMRAQMATYELLERKAALALSEGRSDSERSADVGVPDRVESGES